MSLSFLTPWLERINEKFNARSTRERVLITTLVCGLSYGTAYLLFLQSWQTQSDAQRVLAEQSDANRKIWEAKLGALSDTPLTPEQQQKKDKQTELRKQLADLDSEIANFTQQLISPTQMRELLRRMVEADQKLVLKEIENRKPEPVNAAVKSQITGEATVQAAQLFKHATRVTVTGRYLDLVAYLERLEALPSRLFWGEAEVQSLKYPESQLAVELYTLSDSPNWLSL